MRWLLGTGLVSLLAGIAVATDPSTSVLLTMVASLGVAVVIRPHLVAVLTLPALVVVSLLPPLTTLRPVVLLATPGAAVLGLLMRRCHFTPARSWPLLALAVVGLLSALRAGPAPDVCPPSICSSGTPSSTRDLATFVLIVLNAAAAGVLGIRSSDLLTALRWTTSVVAGLTVLGLLETIERSDARLGALGLNPNFLGAFLALGLVAATSHLIRGPQPASVGQTLLLAAGVGSTGSRGAFVGIAVGLAIVLWARRSQQTRLVVGSLAVVAVILIGVTDSSPEVTFGRERQELDASNDVRVDAAALAIGLGVDNPLLGIGPGHFPSRALYDGRVGIYINTHNEYLRFAAELGVPGALLFGYAVLVGLRKASRVDRTAFAVLGTFATLLLFANLTSNPLVSVTPLALLATLRTETPNVSSLDRIPASVRRALGRSSSRPGTLVRGPAS